MHCRRNSNRGPFWNPRPWPFSSKAPLATLGRGSAGPSPVRDNGIYDSRYVIHVICRPAPLPPQRTTERRSACGVAELNFPLEECDNDDDEVLTAAAVQEQQHSRSHALPPWPLRVKHAVMYIVSSPHTQRQGLVFGRLGRAAASALLPLGPSLPITGPACPQLPLLPSAAAPPSLTDDPPPHPPVQKVLLMTKKDMILAVRLMADEPEAKAAQQQ